jgi:hypothetical protein
MMPLVGLAALLSGSVFWLRRVGWLQADQYWKSYGQRYAEHADPESVNWYVDMMQFHASLHTLDGGLRLIKWPKELLLLAFLLLACTQLKRLRPSPAFIAIALPLLLLMGLAALTTAAGGAWLDLAAGVRSLLCLVLGLVAAPLLRPELLRSLARVCALLLVVQLLLIPIEMQRGLLMYAWHWQGENMVRAVGSFNLPTSLGCFAVVAFAAAWCWGELSLPLRLALLLALVVVLVASASAAAWVALCAVAGTIALARCSSRQRLLLGIASLPLALGLWLALPALTGREDVHDSLWGRIRPVHEYAVAHMTPLQQWTGLGLGHGTNALTQQNGPLDIAAPVDRPVGDSLPAVLLWQLGLAGLLLVYAWMVLALKRDPRSRPLGAALIVVGIAVAATELFPVNLVLGLWLAHGARPGTDDEAGHVAR